MHEVGIISSMLKTIEKVMEQENLTTVETIVLQVGELSGVVPHYMRADSKKIEFFESMI